MLCRGGWPGALRKKTEKAALHQALEYYKARVTNDVSRVDGVKRDPERTKRIMRSYARHQGAQASIQTMLADISVNDVEEVSDETVVSYLAALRKIFVIEDMPAWNPNLRSKTAVRTSDTRYFVDPSVGVAALGLGPNDLINDLNTFGLFFETMCIRDLRVYADSLGGSVYHYRDKNGLECDAVVHLRNGSYGLIEIKLGGDKLIEDGVKTLTTLSNLIDTTKMKSPSFSMVLTGVGDYAYRRSDGIYVVPIGCFRN
jgi:predicted AAA+ superfamily ATPase